MTRSKKSLEWHRACGHLTAQAIMDHIPMAFPKTGTQTGVPGVAKGAKGSRTLTHAGWIALCQVIASKEPVNLKQTISVCEQLQAKL